MEEVEKYGGLKGAEIRKAKEILAFEATKIVHGEAEALKARDASKSLFISASDSFMAEESSVAKVDDSIPTKVMERKEFIQGIPVFKLFEMTSLCSSGSEARRLIEQGGAYLDRKRIDKFDYVVTLAEFSEKNEILLRAGKKKFHRIRI